MYVPAENGLLFRVEEGRNEKYHGLSLDLNARTCHHYLSGGEWLWLPRDVGIVDGHIVPDAHNHWYWAEPDWVAETIQRLSTKPFTEPEGPLCRLIRLDHFTEPQPAGAPPPR